MALTDRSPIRERFALTLPEPAGLDLERIAWSYRRDSDTLLVDLYGRGRPALSVPLDVGERDYLFVRVDVKTDEVVGLQIEDFLAYAVIQHPELVDALTIAELDGIDAADVDALRRRLGSAARSAVTATAVYDQLRRLAA